jgi:hypothetical protein
MTLPLWIVWNPGGGDEGPDDGYKFRAIDAQDAAQQWAHRAESKGWEYTLEETPETVTVCPVDDINNQRKFRVRAQTSRDYFADELSQP